MTQQAVDDLQQGLLHGGKALFQQLRDRWMDAFIVNTVDYNFPDVKNSNRSDLHLTYLSQVSDQVQGYLSKGIVEVATNHVDPVGAVAGIAVSAVQAHHVGQVGQRSRLLICAKLGYFISCLLTKRSRAVKVLDEVW